ncbi:MAG: hypothetical protein CBC25_01240 [Pelagibacteraceae bacterium TMED65]|nr:MAG: hypothetical protein CBC25_01240 [Pelagibacteraceae bacterium TMED65]
MPTRRDFCYLKRDEFGLSSGSGRPLVCVQGLGFVGAAMSVAVALAKDDSGEEIFDVLGVDLPSADGKQRVQSIMSGFFPFQSGDTTIEAATKVCRSRGNLAATTNSRAFQLADIVVVDVNLDVDFASRPPVAAFNSYISAIETIGEHVGQDTLIIVETTVPPGTCEFVVLPTLMDGFKKRGLDPNNILLAHSYERVMPGPDYLNSIVNYWRVYAGISERASNTCQAFLEKIVDTQQFPLRRLSSTTASETAKIMENTYRAVNIALIDEWGIFAENVGIDIFEIIEAIRDRPTHSNMRQPGFGVGGYCLTKDPYFGQIANDAFFKSESVKFPFANMAMETNHKMPVRNLIRILELVNKKPEEITMLMLGVAYRSEVDDTRHSASEIFYQEAVKRGIKIDVHDPNFKYWNEVNITIDPGLPEDLEYDVIVFCVPHKTYRNLNFRRWLNGVNAMIYDCDKVLSDEQIITLKAMGVQFYGAGRG